METLLKRLSERLFFPVTDGFHLKEYYVTVMLTTGLCYTYTINKDNVGASLHSVIEYPELVTLQEKPGEFISIPYSRVVEITWKG